MDFKRFIPAFLTDRKGPWPIIWRLLSESWRKYAPGYAVATIFMAIFAGTLALTAWIIGTVVDEVFVRKDMNQLLLLVGGVLAISIARGASAYGSDVAIARTGNRIVADMQRRVFDHLLKLGVRYFDRNHSSHMIMAMSNRANAASAVISTILTSFVRDLLSIVFLVALMIILNPWLTIIAMIVGPLALIGVGRLVRKIRNVARDEFGGMALIIAGMQETAAGIRIVKAFNLEALMTTRMEKNVEDVRQRRNKIATVKAQTKPFMETLGGFAIAGVIFWGGYATIFQGQDPGTFVSYITAILLAYEPAKKLANTRVALERNVVGVRFVYGILDTQVRVDPNLDGPDLEIDKGTIRFENVDFAYRKKKPLLNGFNFEAPGGQLTALVGPSGSGKSTIMNLIERFYDVQAGAVTVDGQDISKLRIASLRDQLAIVTQSTQIFQGTVRENIRFGRPSATDEEVEAVARSAMAYDFISELPNGFDTVLEEGSGELSGGQLQRVSIARAMLRDAPIVLLDEATSSLDSESEHQIQLAFEHLMVGRTTIVIAHRLSTVLGADKICVVVDGDVIEEGRHEELLKKNGHYARLYHLQFEKHKVDAIEDQAEPVEAIEDQRAEEPKKLAS